MADDFFTADPFVQHQQQQSGKLGTVGHIVSGDP